VNAFSIGDGRIYLIEGAILAATNQDEFAGVIAHEMGNQLAGHFCLQAQAYGTVNAGHRDPGSSAQLGWLRQGMDPAKEREADELSVHTLADAGYDPFARERLISRSRDGMGEGRPAASGRDPLPGMPAAHSPTALARAGSALAELTMSRIDTLRSFRLLPNPKAPRP